MAEKRFCGAPFGTQTARFDVTGVHPNSKVPGSFTQIPYDKFSMLDLNAGHSGSQSTARSESHFHVLRKLDGHLKNIRLSLATANRSLEDVNLKRKQSNSTSTTSSVCTKMSCRGSPVLSKTRTEGIKRSSGQNSKAGSMLVEHYDSARFHNWTVKRLQISRHAKLMNDQQQLPVTPNLSSKGITDCDSRAHMKTEILPLSKHKNDKHLKENIASVGSLTSNGPMSGEGGNSERSRRSENGTTHKSKKKYRTKPQSSVRVKESKHHSKGDESSGDDPEAVALISDTMLVDLNTSAGSSINDKEHVDGSPSSHDELNLTGDQEKQSVHSTDDIRITVTHSDLQDKMNHTHFSIRSKSMESETSIKSKTSEIRRVSFEISETRIPETSNVAELQIENGELRKASLDENKLEVAEKRKSVELQTIKKATSALVTPVKNEIFNLSEETDTNKLVFSTSSESYKGLETIESHEANNDEQFGDYISAGDDSISGYADGDFEGDTHDVRMDAHGSNLQNFESMSRHSEDVDTTTSMSKLRSHESVTKHVVMTDMLNDIWISVSQAQHSYDNLMQSEMFPNPPNSLRSSSGSGYVPSSLKGKCKKNWPPRPTCDQYLKRKLGPGAYNTIVGGFSPGSVELKASGPGWSRQLEVERLAALPHLLHKEQWEENKMLKRKLGPGSYEIKDFIQVSSEKPRSDRGICDYLAPRFDKGIQNMTPGPGTYGMGGVPTRALDEKDSKSASTKGMLDAGDRKRNLPSVGSHLGPGTYRHKTCTDEMLNKVTSLKGPYELYSGDRNKPISEGYLAAPKLADLGPGQYELGTFVDELKSPQKKIHGRFGKMAQYPEIPTDRIFLFSQAHYPKMKVCPGPGAYSAQELSKPQAVNSPGFLSSAKRDDKISQKFFTRNFNPVGPGRYDIQKFDEAQDLNGHSSAFKSKTGKPNLQMSKFLQERIRAKDVRPEDKVFLTQPRMTRSITVM